MELDLAAICQDTRAIAEQAATFIRGELGQVEDGQIETKSLNSLVSYVDQQAEKLLVHALGALLPAAVFLTEEGTVEQGGGDLQWIVDPLDGTTNFLHQVPVFSVSIALLVRQKPVLGIVYEINRRECFWAYSGSGAWCNERRISVTDTAELGDALIGTGFPYQDDGRGARHLEALAYFQQHTRGIRRLGSAATDLAYVAAGRFDAFFEYGLSPWDVAAGAFLVEEAGGKVYDFNLGDQYLHGRQVIAVNSGLASTVGQIIKGFLGDE